MVGCGPRMPSGDCKTAIWTEQNILKAYSRSRTAVRCFPGNAHDITDRMSTSRVEPHCPKSATIGWASKPQAPCALIRSGMERVTFGVDFTFRRGLLSRAEGPTLRVPNRLRGSEIGLSHTCSANPQSPDHFWALHGELNEALKTSFDVICSLEYPVEASSQSI